MAKYRRNVVFLDDHVSQSIDPTNLGLTADKSQFYHDWCDHAREGVFNKDYPAH